MKNKTSTTEQVIHAAEAYPAIRVVTVYALLGGAVGGMLLGGWGTLLLLVQSGDVTQLVSTLPTVVVFGLFGSLIGLVPALLTGLWLAWRRVHRSGWGYAEATAAGAMCSLLCLVVLVAVEIDSRDWVAEMPTLLELGLGSVLLGACSALVLACSLPGKREQ